MKKKRSVISLIVACLIAGGLLPVGLPSNSPPTMSHKFFETKIVPLKNQINEIEGAWVEYEQVYCNLLSGIKYKNIFGGTVFAGSETVYTFPVPKHPLLNQFHTTGKEIWIDENDLVQFEALVAQLESEQGASGQRR
ncbi:MAG: hypothetical protein ACSHYA_20240 [Opitutaceae bacterium]